MTRIRTAIIVAWLGVLTTSSHASAGALSLDVRDVDIYDAVRMLATEANVNVIVDASVPHRPVVLRLAHVSFRQALAALAQSSGLQEVTRAGIVYLGTPDAINHRYATVSSPGARTVFFPLANGVPDDVAHALGDALPAGTLVVADRRAAGVLVTGDEATIARAHTVVAGLDRAAAPRRLVLAMHYVKASEALKAVQATLAVTPPASAFPSDRQNRLVLTGPSDFLRNAAAIVAAVDTPGKQVRYDVRVTDIVPTESSNVGVLFGGNDVNGSPQAASGTTVTTFLRSALAVNATINALVTKGEARILARPSLSTLNDVAASLLVGQQFPIVYFDARTGTQQVQFVDVGVTLNVTPTVGSDGAVTTDLETDYSQITGFVQTFPIVSTRKAQSTLRVRDGETIVIAGLFSDVDSSTLTKVPFLGDIPLIGEIFRNRARSHSRDEVVFLITPHIVHDGDAAADTTIPHPPLP